MILNIKYLKISSSIKLLIQIFFLLTSFTFSQVKSIKVISPNGNEKLQIGTRQSITWISNSTEDINIFYSLDDGIVWTKIANNIDASLGIYGWKVPNLSSNNIKIKISSVVNADIYDISDDFATVTSYDISFKKSNQQPFQPLQIMPLGNSITFDNRANDTRAVEDKIGYRYPLYNLLNGVGYNFDFIGSEHAGSNFFFPKIEYDENAGFPGIKDDQLANLLQTGRLVMPQYGINDTITEGPYLNTYSPDIVLLHIGTNGNDQSDGTSPIDVEKILDEIDWYENTTGTEVIVFLARIINRVPNENYVTIFNDSVETMALDRVNNPANDAYPDNIVIVDMQDSAGVDYEIDSFGTVGDGIFGDMSDFLHPNDKGYLKMAQVWFNSLYSVLGEPISIVSQPFSKGVIEGDSVSFEVNVSGGKPISYQWKKNNIDIIGANDSIYSIPTAIIADSGAEFSCTVYNKVSMVETQPIILYVSDQNSRVTGEQLVFYNFEEGIGNTILDKSGYDEPLNLEINSSSMVSWVPYGLEVENKSIITSLVPPIKIFNKCVTSNEITLETWISPKNLTQGGPARLITFSNDGSNRNFSLGQNADTFISRIRSTETNNNGLPELISTAELVDTSLTHLVFVRNNLGEEYIYINGVLNSSTIIPGTFANWDSTYLFGLANEFNSIGFDRFWIGTFYLVSVYGRALSETEIAHNYTVGFNGNNRLLKSPTNLSGTVESDTTVVLNWTDNENRETGYIIERKANLADSLFVVLDTLGTNTNEYIDYYPKYTTSYYYRLKAYNQFYESDYSDSIIVNNIVTFLKSGKILYKFKLYQNYPNPFNPSTQIRYNIPELSDVSLELYNMLGQKIKTLINKTQPGGEYTINFSGNNLSTGIYFLALNSKSILNSNNHKEIIKLLLLK